MYNQNGMVTNFLNRIILRHKYLCILPTALLKRAEGSTCDSFLHDLNDHGTL